MNVVSCILSYFQIEEVESKTISSKCLLTIGLTCQLVCLRYNSEIKNQRKAFKISDITKLLLKKLYPQN